jgi:hypothetical protein
LNPRILASINSQSIEIFAKMRPVDLLFQYLKFQRDYYGGTVNIFDKLTGFIEEIVDFVGKYGC